MDSNPCGHLSLILRIAPSVLDKCSPPVNIFALDYAFNKTYVCVYISVESLDRSVEFSRSSIRR